MKRPLDNPGFGGVQAIERALILLEHLAFADSWVGISELSQATGQPAGTIHRLLMTLIARGYVTRDERTRRYTLGPACHFLAARFRHQADWKALATPLLQELAEASGETANLAVLEHQSAVYVAQAQSTRLVRMFAEPGRPVPLHATGCGKVLLAYQPEHVAHVVLGQLKLTAFTTTTITDKAQLSQELLQIKHRGYAIDQGEQEEGVHCLAVPVFGVHANEHIQAALSISGPSSRLQEPRLLALLPRLQSTSQALSQTLRDR
jgi:IclR family acetate operon transcriptional repressor